MRKQNPKELAITVYTMFDCPFSKDEVSAITDDVLSASDIEKIVPDETDPNDFPALSIIAKCAEIPGGYIYDYDIDFIAIDRSHGVVRLGSRGHGSYGQGRAETVRNALRRYVERAVASFVAANTDSTKNSK